MRGLFSKNWRDTYRDLLRIESPFVQRPEADELLTAHVERRKEQARAARGGAAVTVVTNVQGVV